MTSVNATNYAAAIKQRWPFNELFDEARKNHPLFGLIRRDEGMYGTPQRIAVQYGEAQGRSATFSLAQSTRTGIPIAGFLVEHAKNYAIVTIDGYTKRITARDPGAVVSAIEKSMSSGLETLGFDIANGLFRSGTGSIGVIGSVSSATLVLATIEDAVNFEVGMSLRVSETDGGSYRTGTEVLGKIDRLTGTLTSTSATWATTIAAIAAGDYIGVTGDLNLKIKGLDGWLPVTVSGSDSFWGVNRSVDRERLAGVYFDGSGGSMEQALQKSSYALKNVSSRLGAKITYYFMNPLDMSDLNTELGSRREFTEARVTAEIAYPGILVNTAFGPTKIITDQNCQRGYAYGLDMDTWHLGSPGQLLGFDDDDGLQFLRQSADDGYELRLKSYLQPYCTSPGRNVRTKLPTAA